MPDIVRWAERAACLTLPPEMFFPEVARGRGAPERLAAAEARAKAVCRRCPVTVECLADALATESVSDEHRHGIRGALNADERGLLRRRPGPAL